MQGWAPLRAPRSWPLGEAWRAAAWAAAARRAGPSGGRRGGGRVGARVESREGQGRLLSGQESAEVHGLAGAPHVCPERLGPARAALLEHAAEARRVVRRLQRKPLGLRLAHGRRGCA